MNGLHNDEEGEGVRLDSGGKKNRRDTTADSSYEFTSITAEQKDDEEEHGKKFCISKVKKRRGRAPSSDQTTEWTRECQGSPNTSSTRSMSTDDEKDPEKHPEEKAEEIPRPRRGLTRGLSWRNATGDSSRGLTRGLSARNLAMGVGTFRKTHAKDQPIRETEDPAQMPEKRSGLFGGGRRRRDKKDDINSHIGEITVKKDPQPPAPAPTKGIFRTRSGEAKKPKKPCAKKNLNSHIGEITITKKPPVDSDVEGLNFAKEAESPDAVPGADVKAAPESEPAVERPMNEVVTTVLGDIAEDNEADSHDGKSTENEVNVEDSNVSVEQGAPEVSSEELKALASATEKEASPRSSFCSQSAHERVRRDKSEHGIDATSSKTTHTPSGGKLARRSSGECSSSSDGSFAEISETGEIQLEGGEDDCVRQFVFQGENKVPRIFRGPCEDTFENEDVIFQFFLDKEHPVVWIEAEEDEGSTEHLELNIAYATKVVVQSKSTFRVAGLMRGATAA